MDQEDEKPKSQQDADEAMEGSEIGNDAEDEAEKKEYVKKEYYARDYVSDGVTEEQVNQLIIKSSRPLITMRMSKPRKEFSLENFQMIEKDAADQTIDLKFQGKAGNITHTIKRKVLQMGLQAARAIHTYSSQTYHKRSVNACVQYRPEDFIDKIRAQSIGSGDLNDKLDRFINKVQDRVEEALQSNEIINVFQDDFEMLGDEDTGTSAKSTGLNSVQRTYFEQEFCKQKTVSCIRFHPTKEHLVAIALVEYFKQYEDRVNLMGLSFESYVLILNFKDPAIITLNYILQTPVEITTIEFHPENPRVMVGGAINGQVIIWDLGSVDHRITAGRKPTVAKMPDEEEDKTQQTAVKLKQLILSNIERSHKNFVADIQFIPKNVRVDKRNAPDGHQWFFMSCSEDAWVHIWDTRSVTVEALSAQVKRFEWTPHMSVNLYRMDGSGEVGLSRLLFQADQNTTTFYGASEEGDMLYIDWSIKPIGDDNKIAENVRTQRDSERNYRPVLALERSPFYSDLVMTIHDFHFAIWKTSIETQEDPIYRSAMSFGTHNTCGAFSPSRPGVIFVTTMNSIDVWDFLDQSNKPSITIVVSQNITYFRFQNIKDRQKRKQKQYMAYGDMCEGTLTMYEVPANLANMQDDELNTIQEFWDTEIMKCDYVRDRRVQMKEDYEAEQQRLSKEAAKAEEEKTKNEDADNEKELAEEDLYQDNLLIMKHKLGLINDEQLEEMQTERKKKKAQ